MIKIKLFRLHPAQIKFTQSTTGHPNSMMETRGTNKDGGLLHSIWVKAQPLQLVCAFYSKLQQLLLLHTVIWVFFSRVFLLCEGALALEKTWWIYVGLYTTEC